MCSERRSDMKCRNLLPMTMLLLVVGAFPPTAVAQTPNPAVADSIRFARREWNRAMESRDTTAFRALLSKTYHSASGFGHIFGADSAVIFAARLFAGRPDLLFQARATRAGTARRTRSSRNSAEHGRAVPA